MREPARELGLWLPPILLMAVIFAFSAVPSGDPDPVLWKYLLRKVAHFGEYALLAALWWRALRARTGARTALAVAFAIAAGYAVTDEIHQAHVRTRVATPRDVAIDATGAGAALALIARRRRRVPA